MASTENGSESPEDTAASGVAIAQSVELECRAREDLLKGISAGASVVRVTAFVAWGLVLALASSWLGGLTLVSVVLMPVALMFPIYAFDLYYTRRRLKAALILLRMRDIHNGRFPLNRYWTVVAILLVLAAVAFIGANAPGV